ncbi:hypothetical protein FHW83_003707 [Duganella sp. SG902]|uniref:hypothetical protein n=1 Tax=Duganella sp. SG902 TaxID=2587016 RepID=UPI00159D9431|nr:hypothetical protein [Duganella sp. SG902]NVM77884.1 hypothetical protein [Duganella sp. SG902]
MEQYITVESNGKLRRLAKIMQRPSGDLLVSIFAGLNNGESTTDKVKDIHFSVHRSPNIPKGNMIKTTILSEESKAEGRAITSSIKGKEGFWNIAAYRYTDLEAGYYDFNSSADNFTLPYPFDTSKRTLILGFAVGDSDEEFDYSGDEFFTYTFKGTYFTLVLLVSTLNGPALPFGRFHVPTTLNPDAPPKGITEEQAYALMRGSAVEQCISRFRLATHWLLADYLERFASLAEMSLVSEEAKGDARWMTYASAKQLRNKLVDMASKPDIWAQMSRPAPVYAIRQRYAIRIIDANTKRVIRYC